MNAFGLSPEAWVLVAAIAGFAVILCLGAIAKMLWYEEALHELKRQVREIRIMRGQIRK